MKKFIVEKQLPISASRERVWNALTDPDLTEKYFFGCRVYSNWAVDGEISFKRRILWIFPIELRGRILEINPGSMLKYSLKNSASTTESIVTIELADNHGKTIVSVQDDVGSGEGAESRYNRSQDGWDKVLNGLKRVIEKETKG